MKRRSTLAVAAVRGGGFLAAAALWLTLSGFGRIVNPGDCKFEDAKFRSEAGGCRDLGAKGVVWSAPYSNTGSSLNHSQAVSYCANLDEGGYQDWRLPTKDELVNVAVHDGGVYANGTPGPSHLPGEWVLNFYHWSSTTKGTPYAYVVWLVNGGIVKSTTKTSSVDVQCVR